MAGICQDATRFLFGQFFKWLISRRSFWTICKTIGGKTKKHLGSYSDLSEPGFDPGTCGLWAHHASAAPLWLLSLHVLKDLHIALKKIPHYTSLCHSTLAPSIVHRPLASATQTPLSATPFYRMRNHLFSLSARRLPLPLRRFLSHSLHGDLYDPPFSPSPKPFKANERKKKKKKNNSNNSEKNGAPNLPLKSDLPFDFRYSYSESDPSVRPISFRESPKFSPFGPGRLDRKWTGTSAPVQQEVDRKRLEEERNRVLGEPLSEDEVAELVERYRHSDCARQINLGNLLSLFILSTFSFFFFLIFFNEWEMQDKIKRIVKIWNYFVIFFPVSNF